MLKWSRSRAGRGPGRWRGLLLASAVLFTVAGHAAESTREARNNEFLTVCADPNNLPYSNKQGEGFENKVAELIARETGRELRYHWWPQTIGLVRNTLRLRRCDLLPGITAVNELVQNTNPYYRSVYALVYRTEGDLAGLQDLDDPRLAGRSIGVVAGTPPATVLARRGLLDQVRSYLRTVDTRHYSPAQDALQDVAEGRVDLAIIWGPIAGHFTRHEDSRLTMVPLAPRIDGEPMAFNVSMGLRHRETRWKHALNELLSRLAPQINTILLDYGLPLLDQNDQPIRP